MSKSIAVISFRLRHYAIYAIALRMVGVIRISISNDEKKNKASGYTESEAGNVKNGGGSLSE